MDIYELIGFIIGDGSIFYNKKYRKYRLELDGNVEEDYDYFVKIKDFLKELSPSKPQFFIHEREKGKTLRIMLYDKNFMDKLISMGIPAGKKTFTITIPRGLTEENVTSVIRGLFEADGCLYFSKSKVGKYPTYPRLEIKTSSESLLAQLKGFLVERGFNPYIRRSKSDRTPAIGVSGEKSLEKWRSIFGFVSLKNQTKYNFWKTKGFYIPRTPLSERTKYAHVA